ncbi:MAG TPA: C39 family peptidase [Patescibacteria group bacterium]|nr:C39 family peptidase [Patescibacteria group bacterium]
MNTIAVRRKRTLIVILALALLGGVLFFIAERHPSNGESFLQNSGVEQCTAEAMLCPDGSSVSRISPTCDFAPCPESPVASDPSEAMPADAFSPPLSQVGERVTKKPFGIFITPKTSPVQPERFSGYHVGTDFEIFPEEIDKEVPIFAICTGELLRKDSANGYGGYAIQRCEIDNAPVTVLYGHLKRESITSVQGAIIATSTTIGTLGADKSSETDGERKHLHMSIYKGAASNIRGYVQTQTETNKWIDPCTLFHCSNETSKDILIHEVPFTAQAPTGNWSDPIYQDACEEASLLMAVRWAQNHVISRGDALETIANYSMQMEKQFGSAVDLSSQDLTTFAKQFDKISVTHQSRVTVEEMISALGKGNIVIVPINGQKIGNPHYTLPGPLYHMLVIWGYDPATKEFITNDPGTKFGKAYRYSEKTLYEAMQDYVTGNHGPIFPDEKIMLVVAKRQ